LNATAIDVLEKRGEGSRKPGRPSKSRTTKSNEVGKKEKVDENESPRYHFIGYVPAFGKVWELDGLKSGPLEVGELTSDSNRHGWMDVARPALRLKMAKYGGSGLDDSDIRFSLLAITEDVLLKLTDELEFLRKDKDKLESLLKEDWEQAVIILLPCVPKRG
jgi:ubiquitin carboxyl-terminal hydrolase L5